LFDSADEAGQADGVYVADGDDFEIICSEAGYMKS
jgi:hypothetical protein